MSDIVLDIETLSTRPDAVVLTIGAIKFSPFADDIDATNGFYTRIDVDEQIGMGRHISEDTIQWWGKLPAEVREDAMGEHNRDSVEKALAGLNKFLVGSENIWVQGPVFDIATLENLYRQMLMPPPWHFWNIRDSRTLFGVHGDPRERNKAGLHNALEDCVSQAQGVQQIYNRLGIVKP